jgi:hypothetical protein
VLKRGLIGRGGKPMLNVLSGFFKTRSKSVSEDPYIFPEQCLHFLTERVASRKKVCEPFKVYLPEPEIAPKGTYIWRNVATERGLLPLVECRSSAHRKLYRGGKSFIVRIVQIQNGKQMTRTRLLSPVATESGSN